MNQLPGSKGAEKGRVCPWGLGKQDGARVTRPRIQAEQQALDTGGLHGPQGRPGTPEESAQALNVGGGIPRTTEELRSK